MASLPSSSSIDFLSRQLQFEPQYLQHHHLPQQQQPQHHVYHPHIVSGQRRRGVTKFFNSLKGFGFVVDQHPEELGGQEVFCHFSAISGKGGFRSLAEGEEVEYELVTGPKGFQAANLTGPGGRNVVGDPKARLSKLPTYMPFAPMSMPFGSDPFQHQHQLPAGHNVSPYTQHVVYVPTSLQQGAPTSFAYTSLPPSQPQGSALLASPPVNNGSFASSSSFAPSHNGHQQSYPTFSAIPNGGAYGGSVPASLSIGSGHHRSVSTSLGTLAHPSSYSSHNVDMRGPASNPGPSGFAGPLAFAPFNSPPAQNNAQLFETARSSDSSGPTSTSSFGFGGASTASRNSATTFGSISSINGSSLFNGSSVAQQKPMNGSVGPVGPIGSPLGRNTAPSVGSVSSVGTAAPGFNGLVGGERRTTPLGNGTLSGGGGFGPVLYASSGGNSF